MVHELLNRKKKAKEKTLPEEVVEEARKQRLIELAEEIEMVTGINPLERAEDFRKTT